MTEAGIDGEKGERGGATVLLQLREWVVAVAVANSVSAELRETRAQELVLSPFQPSVCRHRALG